MRYLYLITLLLSFAGRGLAQEGGALSGSGAARGGGMDELLSTFDSYRNGVVQEKLFVHTDKPVYLAGEISWFKIYCVEAGSHRSLSLSKVAYVDVVDNEDRPVLQGKIALVNSEGRGSFFLPLTLSSGNYKLRAYTNWMKNFGPDYFFEQPIMVINTLKEMPAAAGGAGMQTGGEASLRGAGAGVDSDYFIAWFPEGGDLVKDIPTRVGFRITSRDGKGVDGQGVVMDENRDTVAVFAAMRFGIGQFRFTPTGEHVYRAVIACHGDTIGSGLPVVHDRGYVMNVHDEGTGQVRVTVGARGALSPEIYLFARAGPDRRLSLKAELVHDSAVFVLNKDSLGVGINQLTVFDGVLEPVAERLYFRRPLDPLSIEVRADQPQYAKRSKINLAVIVRDTSTHLSISVYRIDSLMPGAQPADIYSYLWLGSDLKGRVESPEYYLLARGAEADQALDNLMLTHGWRRFRWESIRRLARRELTFPYPPEHNGHIVMGRLTDTRTGGPVSNRISFLTSPGTAYRFQAALSDSGGKVFFDVKDFYGPDGIILHAGSAADSPFKVDIFSPFSEQYAGDHLPSFGLSGAQRRSLALRSENMQVQNIYSGDSLHRFRIDHSDSLHFYGIPDHSYLLDDYTRFTTIEEVLREYVREINVTRPRGRSHLLMLDEPRREFFEDDNTLVLLDGIPVPDDKIFFYDPLKVRKLEVIPRRYFLGPAEFSGVASFTTYKGDFDGLELDRHSMLIDYEGLQWQREFYAPVYETEPKKSGRLPDFRDLLFWSADLSIDGQGHGAASFYSSDLPGTYRIVVQGISSAGDTGSASSGFEVR
jgi:hypothetical protein